MDLITFFMLLFGVCLLLPLGWLLGRLMDLNQRCKWMRTFMKKDYRLLKVKFKGTRVLFTRIVDVAGGVITVGGKQWVLAGKRMYMEANAKVGYNITQMDKDPTFDDGCPVIYVDDENITPLVFQGDDTNVRPEELGATYSGYLVNQLYKALSFIKNIKTLLMLAVFISLACGVLGYLILQKVSNIEKMAIDDHAVIMTWNTTTMPLPTGTGPSDVIHATGARGLSDA